MSADRETSDYLDLIRAAHEEGRAAAEREMAERWNDIAAPVAHGSKTQAELEELRWGPAGREHFGDPRPADYMGGPVKWAEPERTAPSHRVPSPRQDVERATAAGAAAGRARKEPGIEKEAG